MVVEGNLLNFFKFINEGCDIMIKRRDENKMPFCLCDVSCWNGGSGRSEAQCIWAFKFALQA